MMLCLISIVVYGNAKWKDQKWFSRYELSLRSSSTRKPGVFGLRVAKRIEKTDLVSASFMMLCLLSIVVYGNAKWKDQKWFSRYELSLRSSSTRKPLYLGLRVTKCIEKTDIKISASFIMLCLISIVVYGNADW